MPYLELAACVICLQGVEFFELPGDGDPSVSRPSIFEGFFFASNSKVIDIINLTKLNNINR